MPGHRVDHLLGEGGFAQVWAGERIADGACVAIKVAYAATSVTRARFANEAEALRAIGAPYVPVLHDHGTLPDGRPYVIMERLDDDNLATLLQTRRDPPDVAWICDVGDAVLASLEVVHGRQLVHRDLKPDNIFLSRSRPYRARLIDFGIVTREPTERSSSEGTEHAILGTAEYMAPEQLLGRSGLDARVDIYAFGVLLYELLTLRVPFVGDLASVEKGHSALRPTRPSELVTVPAALEALCLACLAKDVSRRPPDVITLRRRLHEACRDAGDARISERTDPSGPQRLLLQSRQPVVLVAVEVPSLERSLTDTITRRKGFLARQQGLRLIAAFSGVLVEKPEQVALSVAQELVEQHAARVVLHFAELTMRPSGQRAPKLYGPAVQEPATWMPPGPWTGLLMTPDLADILPEGRTQPSPAQPGFHELAAVAPAPRSDEKPLFGREDVLARAIEEFHASLGSATPGLFTIIGEYGMGKSRLARAISWLVRRDYPDVELIRLHANRRASGKSSELQHDLVRTLARRLPGGADSDVTTSSFGTLASLGHEIRLSARAAPLAIIVDDAHLADDAMLDALEYATLDGTGMGLWIVACAHPRLEKRRPQWGRHAHRHTQIRLGPLDPKAAMDMAAAELRPAEFPPQAVLEKLAQWTAGNPQTLEQLVRTLKRGGFVRQSPDGNSWYVATAELDKLPASPVGQWLAARQLDTLPPEQAACVRVCAVLGQDFTRDELAWVLSAAERDGHAGTTIDTDVGITALEEQGIITRVRGDLWSFAKGSFQDAIYKLVSRRDRENIHASALAYWQAQAGDRDSDRAWACIARHAGACGAADVAADAHLEFGDRARREHRHVEADLHYSAALGFIDEADHARCARALGGLGRVRYRMQRVQESIADLRRAEEHALALGDRALAAELLLEEAISLDWAARYAESARRVDQARALIEDAAALAPTSVRLRARYLMSEGRSHYRAGRAQPAIERLGQAVDLAERAGDDETRIIALLLLAAMLAFTGQLDDAQQRFETVISLCERARDRFHLCVAYNNRAFLWSAKKSLANLRTDLRRSIRLAREIGQPTLERGAAHNLAEFLYWSGNYQDALTLARRAYDLQRFMPERIAADALLLARILAASGQLDEARAMVDEARHLAQSGEPAISDELVIKMLDLALAAPGSVDAPDWTELVSMARERFAGEEFLEVLFFRGRVAMAAARWSVVAEVLASARPKLGDYPIWEAPFASLARALPGGDDAPDS